MVCGGRIETTADGDRAGDDELDSTPFPAVYKIRPSTDMRYLTPNISSAYEIEV
jgi:hypothetical protein